MGLTAPSHGRSGAATPTRSLTASPCVTLTGGTRLSQDQSASSGGSAGPLTWGKGWSGMGQGGARNVNHLGQYSCQVGRKRWLASAYTPTSALVKGRMLPSAPTMIRTIGGPLPGHYYEYEGKMLEIGNK